MMFVHIVTIFCFILVITEAGKIDFPLGVSFYNSSPKSIFLKGNGLSFKHPDEPLQHHLGMLGIVNGQPASQGQFCYQAYLQFSDGRSYWSCGGSLVSPSVVLTAAHCVQGASSAVVVLGGLDLSQRRESGRLVLRVPSSGLLVHSNYDENTIYNDIAIVRLTSPVSLSQYVCTVKLPSCTSGDRSNSQSSYTVSGWGKTSDRTRTWRLMYASVAGESLSSCANFYRSNANYRVTESQLCTSGSGGKSTCNGDSGGPLVQTDSSGNLVQRGIVSLGMSSCETSAPSVYTDVSFFMSWLCPLIKQ